MDKIAVTEEEIDGLLRGAQDRVHDAGGGDAARDPRRGAGEAEGAPTPARPASTSASTKKPRRRPRRSATRAQGRGLRDAGRGQLRRAVEGQRRADRSDQSATSCRRQLLTLVEALKAGEVTQPMRTPRGYQIIKLESPQRDGRAAARRRCATRWPIAVFREKGRPEMVEVPEEAARAGDHRVEERRAEEGLRGLPGASPPTPTPPARTSRRASP